jgi:anti-sigma regulatory factor (Ser/Thr protein kinase)
MTIERRRGGKTKDTMMIASPPARMLVALPLRPEAARLARREIVARAPSDDISHTAQLLVTELVANCIRHAAMDPQEGQIVLYGRLTPDHVRIEVADTGQGFDPDDSAARPGLGMRLLDKLATSWGTAHSDRGFRVWFEIDRRPQRFSRSERH